MRRVININKDWRFKKGIAETELCEGFENINVPHTWNAIDGSDGGNDYFRGICTYVKTIGKIDHLDNEKVFIEFKAVSQTCRVLFNGHEVGEHRGGYSTFRFEVTDFLNDTNILVVYADNSPSNKVYPQRADFTFYGGIYRDVNVIVTDSVHFDLMYNGGCGIQVTPDAKGEVEVIGYVSGGEDKTVEYEIYTREGNLVSNCSASVVNGISKAVIQVPSPHLWDGVNDPYLYRLNARLKDDEVSVKFGFRSFSVDPEKGFLLNNRPYDLIGCSRHQDREGYGCALSREMHKEDMDIIREMGATTVRLAHYQHDDYVYELADEYGLIIWAEIPYISEHMEEANDNAFSQMKELIIQNYNHPCIVCWGLSNEITVVGGVAKNCYINHLNLNNYCHELDKTRYTTMANLFMLETDSPLVTLPDIRSYNLYYGWYVGDMNENEKWLDQFHIEHPDVAIGLSEYGADANPQYQTSNPVRGDYSETYQALYHEHMMKIREERPWIWAMHAWNMFDFAADARDEGGKKGQNQKGLVTFDRKIKKDAFYVYKAYLSKEKFVHIAGKRYIDRSEEVTKIKVYSNLEKVSLYVDEKPYETKIGKHVFEFELPISSCHKIRAESEGLSDEMIIRKVSKPNPEYECESKMDVSNWFDSANEGIDKEYFSIYDKVIDIKNHPIAGAFYAKVMEEAMKSFGDVAKNVQIPKEMQEKMDNMTLEANLKMAGHMIKPEMVKALNENLQKIKK